VGRERRRLSPADEGKCGSKFLLGIGESPLAFRQGFKKHRRQIQYRDPSGGRRLTQPSLCLDVAFLHERDPSQMERRFQERRIGANCFLEPIGGST
jgi:hypothetical protein